MPSKAHSKVIDIHQARERLERETAPPCHHKDVVVYRESRRVFCALCGQELDPFDVLVTVVEAQDPFHPDTDLPPQAAPPHAGHSQHPHHQDDLLDELLRDDLLEDEFLHDARPDCDPEST